MTESHIPTVVSIGASGDSFLYGNKRCLRRILHPSDRSQPSSHPDNELQLVHQLTFCAIFRRSLSACEFSRRSRAVPSLRPHNSSRRRVSEIYSHRYRNETRTRACRNRTSSDKGRTTRSDCSKRLVRFQNTAV